MGQMARILCRCLDGQRQRADMYLSLRLIMHCLKMLHLH